MTATATLDPPIVLEDVADVRAFAVWQVGKSAQLREGLTTEAEKEEAIQEAVALIFELHGDWDPTRCAKFSAFLLTYLPKRLVSWYRVELRQSGRGRWSGSTGEYKYNGMVSIDAMEDGGAFPDERREEATAGTHFTKQRGESALTTYGPEDEANGDALEDLLAEVSSG